MLSVAFAAIDKLNSEHDMLIQIFNSGLAGVSGRLDLLIILILTCFGFAAGAYVFAFKITQPIWKELIRLETNHIKHIEDRLKKVESVLNEKEE